MRSSLIILFVKAPLPGDVKTRLAAVIGREAAVDLYRLFVLDMVDMLQTVQGDVRVYFSPREARDAVASLLGPGRELRPQNGRDLGERMENAFRDAFADGYERAVLVGSDLPELTAGIVTGALASLDRNQAVLGPAADGGYYLIGFRKQGVTPDAFHGIAWSTPSVFADTVKILREKALRLHLLPELHDVDSAADLLSFWERNRTAGNRRSRLLEYLEKNRSLLEDRQGDIPAGAGTADRTEA